ncbi:tubulin beta-3 chain-like, partial [Aedes aegypti]|uniref:Tubulin/FtsZ GTPase domain-containing protein n=1 Tax=Aedes aegypti TaxID=7159 RepID=A0A903VBZ6_AEDAE
ETICEEHCLNERGQFIGKHFLPLQRINVYFEEAPCCNLVPRAIFADLEPGAMVGLKCSRFGQLFSPESMVNGMLGAGNNWARGYHTEGAEMLDRIMNVARKWWKVVIVPRGSKWCIRLAVEPDPDWEH